jgi:hypothetical protein
MRMRFVGMQDERKAMLQGELLPREISNSSQYLVRRCARRHREHELVNKLRRLPAVGRLEIALSTRIVDVEIPILDQRLADSCPAAARRRSVSISNSPFARCSRNAWLPPEVVAARPALSHHFWRALDRPSNLFDLRGGQSPACLVRATATEADDVQQRDTFPGKPKGSLRHARRSNS